MATTTHFVVILVLHFLVWIFIGRNQSNNNCSTSLLRPGLQSSFQAAVSGVECNSEGTGAPEGSSNNSNICGPPLTYTGSFDFTFEPTRELMSFRDGVLGKYSFPDTGTVVNPYGGSDTEEGVQCTRMVHSHASLQDDWFRHDCTALVFAQIGNESFNGLRFNQAWRLRRRLYNSQGVPEPSGFFKVPGHENGRVRLAEKMGPFLQHLPAIEEYCFKRLKERGILPPEAVPPVRGAPRPRGLGDVVVMVVNEGEMDLLANLACSLERYGVSPFRLVVFTASAHLVPRIDALGFLGLHHESFAFASHLASAEYLDQTFVDMMWYKAFSVMVALRLGLNVLFQDVDLVWFKDPLPHMRELAAKHKSLALFSDDGQRGIRYTPFFANSGLYYLVSSAATENLAWTVMTLFDVLQRTGSHQNVVALRLLEALDLGGVIPVLLDPRIFPNGDQFHHDPVYMSEYRAGKIDTYNFHMCWTLNKAEKIVNFRSINQWYLDQSVPGSSNSSKASTGPGGTVCRVLAAYKALGGSEQVPEEEEHKRAKDDEQD